MNKSLHAALVKICTSGGGPLSHSSYYGIVARKMLPTQSIFLRPEQMEVRRRQIRTIRWVWWDSPAKIDNVLYGLQTCMCLALSRCKRIEDDIQLCTLFPNRNPPIGADELIKTLFISWFDSCSWPSGTWLVLHVAVATAETRHPPPHCANIYCSGSQPFWLAEPFLESISMAEPLRPTLCLTS